MKVDRFIFALMIVNAINLMRYIISNSSPYIVMSFFVLVFVLAFCSFSNEEKTK